MTDTRVIKSISGNKDLCETFTDGSTKVLLQVETDIMYGSAVIDIIKGYDENGKPYSNYTYQEVDKVEENNEIEGGELDG